MQCWQKGMGREEREGGRNDESYTAGRKSFFPLLIFLLPCCSAMTPLLHDKDSTLLFFYILLGRIKLRYSFLLVLPEM